MATSLTGRVAVVTGSAQGLGREYARRLHRAGASVAVVDVLADRAAETAAELAADGDPARALAVPCDITDEDAVRAMADQVISTWTGPLVLVTNAGGALIPSAPAQEHSRTDWDRVLGVNLTGQWLCARAFAPTMQEQGYGKIIAISSSMVAKGWPLGLAPYVAAKAGVIGLVRALARELGPDGVRVNALAPGYVPVATEKATHSSEFEPQLRARISGEQCLPGTLTPADLCGPVEFLAAADSDAITGQVLNVDAGWSMSSC